MKEHMRKVFRDKFVKLFAKAVSTPAVRYQINKMIAVSLDQNKRTKLKNFRSPYIHEGFSKTGSKSTQSQPIFITGRFRSGSTLLWQLFRNMNDTTAFYEPLNERRWFLPSRGSKVDISHIGVEDYWSEYKNMEHLELFYKEDWIRYSLYMDEFHFDFQLKEYLNALINSAMGRAVLQLNRVDFRLPWLRHNFPTALVLHIYRNPRNQWCSVLGKEHTYGCFDPQENFTDRFYLNLWVRDLVKQFPFLADFDGKHRYYHFYLLWKLSFIFGINNADLSISLEELTSDPEKSLNEIYQFLGKPDHFSIKDLKPIIRGDIGSQWQYYATDEWFSRIELECEAVLDEYFLKKDA